MIQNLKEGFEVDFEDTYITVSITGVSTKLAEITARQ